MTVACLPSQVHDILLASCALLHARSAFRLPCLILGILLAKGRRTVTSWLRAASLQDDFPNYYYFLSSFGKHPDSDAALLLRQILRRLPPQACLRFAIDDTPTKRYGPHVQGAGIHHNPTPGPANHSFLYGHSWVYLSLLVTHPHWGVLSLPINVRLYIRQKDIPKLSEHHRWTFRTKVELAVELINWLAETLRNQGQAMELVVDGGYANGKVLAAAARHRITLMGRLRRDAALRSVPKVTGKRGQGRPPTYGPDRIRLSLRAGQRRGWRQVEARQYGKVKSKCVKTFEATWRPAGGKVWVVLVEEDHGWLAFFSTAARTAQQILESMASRFAIEEMFKDLKEVEGVGQQQVRNLYANVGVVHLNNWEYVLVEVWSWSRSHEELVDRSLSPWDRSDRRPSHAEKRKSLQRACREEEYRRVVGDAEISEKLRDYIQRLIQQAA